jgi:hypothetical protein
MNKRRKVALVAATAFLFGCGLTTIGAPYAIRRYVESNYPGVTVDEVKIRPTCVQLKLYANRPGYQAKLPDVRVGWDKRVVVTGGTVSLTLGEDTSAIKAERKRMAASKLEVTVTKGDWKALLMDVGLREDGTVTVSEGLVNGPDLTAHFTGAERTPTHIYKIGAADLTYSRKVYKYAGVTGKATKVVLDTAKGATVEHLELTPEDGPVVTAEGVTVAADRLTAHANTVIALNNRAENVTLQHKGDSSEISIGSGVIQHEWINPVPVVFDQPIKVTVTGGVITATLGDAGISWFRDSKTLDGVGTCSAWVATFPVGLREALEGFTFTGKVDFRVVYGDKPSISINGACRAKCDAAKLRALSKPFSYKVYTAKNDLVDRTSGPGSADWIPLGILPPGLADAAITMEDPGFLLHRGFMAAAYNNSLVDNLKLGRFHRGGSTITMQLAKNLWLRRDKTLGRKAQEFFLAQAIESCFTKDQILELYLNVVEYGPDLYGIGPGAKHYFKVSPARLTPVESFWLMSILPRPRSAAPPDAATLDRIRKLMGRFVENGRIPDSYLDTLTAPPQDDSEWGQ